MQNKALNRLTLISSNAFRQVLVAVFGMLVPLLVIRFSSKALWGSFVSVLLFTLLAIQVINWGNKEYLLRQFSANPSGINSLFSKNMASRFPLLLLFALLGFWLFPPAFGPWIALWLLGRYLTHATEALVQYEKAFTASIVIELCCFGFFMAVFFYLTPGISLAALLVGYSLYQLLKGFAYFGLFWRSFSLTKARFSRDTYQASFSFFLLSVLGFLASKADVYVMDHFGTQKQTAEYQIINSFLVFAMSVATFVFGPFTRMIYRNTDAVLEKSKRILAAMGLVIVPLALVLIALILHTFLNLELGLIFYISGFLYVYPSYLYGLDIVNLFRQQREIKVVAYLAIGAFCNCLMGVLLLQNGYGIMGVLSGSAFAQLVVLCLFKLSNKKV